MLVLILMNIKCANLELVYFYLFKQVFIFLEVEVTLIYVGFKAAY